MKTQLRTPREERLAYGIAVDIAELNSDGTLIQCGGSHADVEAWLERYLRHYAPEGYGTRVEKDQSAGGTRTITVSRYGSCD